MDENEAELEEKNMMRGCVKYGHILVIGVIVISVIIFIVYVALGGLNLNTI